MSTPQRRMVRATRQTGLFHQPEPKVAGIVLAAGSSRRMGQPKQLLPFRGRTVIERVVENALASSLQRVIVVLGHEAERIKPLLEQKSVTTVINSAYETGQSSSLKAGLNAIPVNFDAALFLLGDQPLVTAETIDLIMAGFADSHAPIVIPTFDGQRGNPVLFSRETFPLMDTLNGDCGARTLFQEYAGRIRSIEVQTPAILMDLDTEEDYRRLLARL
ncbi:molybdopterin-dioxomolybdenum cytidylyltransferase, putative [Geotalea daltonii FRC-32]|uniref:Molybdopterin-dioxomolybdenum cytidylyltransferase, putative n=1 Tax=Geotalea daltonii (strain DSM 22248 / JCM 15807 / FRC-32) TaxID=316067 RepID=B9M8E1_GEODF|nr:molybdenum cofactor cytidylyltransferase [Geotalea daltonii]ACM18476.1 molybdopterin-dioxomolybdenum cytidylyltransferase, putative [Geotalea daltonii FRC-32]